MAVSKTKLRTSEEAYKRLRFAVEFDEDSEFFGDQNLRMGYEDGLYGPMEQLLSAFIPINQGGDLPFHSVWYFRTGDRILWDRRRRLDELWSSGDTENIRRVARGEKVKGFDPAADKKAMQETMAAVAQSAATMASMEEERQLRLAEKQKQRQRQQAKKQREKEERERQALAEKPRVDAKSVDVLPVGTSTASPALHSDLRILTWNALDDAHADAYPIEARPSQRAPGLARAICAQEPDVVAMQEATAAVIEAMDIEWPNGCWRTNATGELVVWSRHPIIRAVAVKLGPDTSKEALLVEIAVQRRAVAIACVHFTSDFHGENAVKRAMQAKVLLAGLADCMPHADVFVCGDFNEPNAVGEESAALCMDSLADAWLAVHGTDHPGYTFDPSQNRLADLGAVCKTPRRMDRIFATPVWSAKSAAVLGEGLEHSDHFGVLATFARTSSLDAEPVHTSAVVLIPPQSVWEQIDEIRKRFDKSYGRWMPHINLIYGFLPEAHFSEAALAMEAVVRRHGPMEVRLEELTLFEHANSASLVIVPRCSPDGVDVLQQELQALFPACVEQSSRTLGFQSHLTLGKFEGESWAEDARRWKAELGQAWKPISFVASEVSMIARTGDQPFSVKRQLPLGSLLKRGDAFMLDALEAGSRGARAFAIGSAALLGRLRPESSDLDVLLVGTRDRDAVFRDLESSMNDTWARRAGGNFPLLQMEVEGTKLDIQYARSSSLNHPVLWPTARCDDGVLAAAALQDAYKLRATVLAMCGMKGWQTYQHALLKLKRWAKSRYLDSNALGYLGGFSWSLLLADTLLTMIPDLDWKRIGVGDKARNVEEALVLATCRRFAEWTWPKPVSLGFNVNGTNASDDLMPILCLTEPYANSARNVTRSTLGVMQTELQRWANGEMRPPLEDCRAFVRCEISAADPASANCAAHWLEARLLVLVRKMDHMNARPLRVGPRLYAVGTSANLAALQHVADEFHAILARDDDDGDSWVDSIRIQVDDRESFKQHVQATCRQGSMQRTSRT